MARAKHALVATGLMTVFCYSVNFAIPALGESSRDSLSPPSLRKSGAPKVVGKVESVSADAVPSRREMIHRTLRLIYDAQCDCTRASNELRQLIAIRPDVPSFKVDLGDILTAKGRYQEAMNLFNQAIKMKPDYAAAYDSRGNCFETMNQLAQSAENYARAIALDPGDFDHRLRLAAVLLKQHRANLGLQQVDVALRMAPGSARCYLFKASCLLSVNKIAQAEKACLQAQRLSPTRSAVQIFLGDLMLRQHKYSAALNYFNRAIKFDPDRPEGYFWLAEYCMATNYFTEAITQYMNAEAVGGVTADLELRIGEAMHRQGRMDMALDHLDQAGRLSPGNDDVRLATAGCLLEMARYDEAIAEYLKVKRHRSRDVTINMMIGTALMRQKNYAKATTFFQEAVTLDPKNLAAYVKNGQCYQFMNNFHEAAVQMMKVSQLRPNDLAMRGEVVSLLLKSNEVDAATHFSVLKHSGVSDDFVKQANLGLFAAPASLRKELFSSGVKVVLAPTTVEYAPELRHEHPRGYNRGSTYANVPAYYGANEVVMGEKFSPEGMPESMTQYHRDAACTILHELGHSYDEHKNSLSHSRAFVAAFASDAKILSPLQRTMYAYFLQPNGAGQEELFAELFSTYYCRRSRIAEGCETISTDFPHCYKFISELLDKIGGN